MPFASGSGNAGPLELFSTWVHETSHAVVGVLVGSSIERVDLSGDGSGVTHISSSGSPSDFSQVAIGSAGYVGTVIVGALLLALGSWARASRIALGVVGGFMVLTALLWMPSVFSFGVSVGLGVVLVVLAFILPDRWVRIATTGLGALTIFEGLLRLVDVGDTTTDAVLTSHFSGASVGLIRGVWIVIGLVAAVVGLLVRTGRLRRTIAKGPPPLAGPDAR
jgi:Peptidase M50B-like